MTPFPLYVVVEWHLKSPIMIQGGVSLVQYQREKTTLGVSIEWLEHVSPGFSSGTLAKGG